ncbi:hypothetical protein HK097_007734 [Rhizophlyctis rosea]|uniref:Uncharacterized protein n=1 Tax=Rhizophlyctis rosea TaxID=64517 RepID=A0AAD5SB80_9FUNG|nr:hypothetical protein HK097_007734 [Rhizophlyctis rosea]
MNYRNWNGIGGLLNMVELWFLRVGPERVEDFRREFDRALAGETGDADGSDLIETRQEEDPFASDPKTLQVDYKKDPCARLKKRSQEAFATCLVAGTEDTFVSALVIEDEGTLVAGFAPMTDVPTLNKRSSNLAPLSLALAPSGRGR